METGRFHVVVANFQDAIINMFILYMKRVIRFVVICD
jgi:hypothetical protein